MICTATLLLPFNVSANADFQPFEIRDQNLFNLIHGQSVPTDAALVPRSRARWSSSLIITNTTNIQSSNSRSPGSEDIYLDYESWRINLGYQLGLNEDWNLRIDLPVVYQSGGIFDSSIDSWHQFFGLPRGQRPQVENNQYDIHYDIDSVSRINLTESSTSLGDLQLAAARRLIENENTQLSLWANIKLPTGDEDKLSSSGATDISAWLAMNHRLNQRWLLNLNGGSVIPGDDDYKNIPVSDYVLYGHAMLGWLLSDKFSLKAQFQGHSSYYEQSQLKILGDTYLLTLGTSIKINQCQHLDFAFTEDIKVDSSPDISLLINWRGQTTC
jgi:hypothetical protein